MIDIFNKQLKPNQLLGYALQHVYGINKKIASIICIETGLNPNIKIKKFTQTQLKDLKHFIETTYKDNIYTMKYKETQQNIQNLILIKNYRGSRHLLKLPVRGQRTHSNAHTQKKFKRFK